MERIDALLARSEQLTTAYLTNFAMSSPEQLQAERERLELEIATPPGEAVPALGAERFSRDELIEAASALFGRAPATNGADA